MAGLCVIYGRECSKLLIDVYFKTLADYDYREVVLAIEKFCKSADNSSFFPKPGDLIKMLDGDGKTKALQAFSKTMQGVSVYDTVVFDDPIIHKVIADMGGWQRHCLMKESDLPWRQKEFVERYEGYVLNPPENYAPRLIGLQGEQDIKFIGDKNRCQMVLEHQPAQDVLKTKPLAIGCEKTDFRLVA